MGTPEGSSRGERPKAMAASVASESSSACATDISSSLCPQTRGIVVKLRAPVSGESNLQGRGAPQKRSTPEEEHSRGAPPQGELRTGKHQTGRQHREEHQGKALPTSKQGPKATRMSTHNLNFPAPYLPLTTNFCFCKAKPRSSVLSKDYVTPMAW